MLKSNQNKIMILFRSNSWRNICPQQSGQARTTPFVETSFDGNFSSHQMVLHEKDVLSKSHSLPYVSCKVNKHYFYNSNSKLDYVNDVLSWQKRNVVFCVCVWKYCQVKYFKSEF